MGEKRNWGRCGELHRDREMMFIRTGQETFTAIRKTGGSGEIRADGQKTGLKTKCLL